MRGQMCLGCCRRMYFLGYKFGGRRLQLDGILLDNGLGDWRDIVVEEKVVCTCCLSEWVY
jgi:hypothetical protein